jgi:GNAT superfamily N-acetyltransferase
MEAAERKILPLYGQRKMDVGRLLMQTLPTENISDNFVLKVLLDPNFDPAGALVAMDGDWAIGFVLALTCKRPMEDAPMENGRGWITLFAVDRLCRRQGVGTALFNAAERWLHAQGCHEVWISPYAPGYWMPGVDEAAYPEAITFLARRGYTTAYRPLSMALSLADWRAPRWMQTHQQQLLDQNVRVEIFQASWSWPLSEFLRREFPGDWQRHMRETMLDILNGRRPQDELLIAYETDAQTDTDTILGFAQAAGERFGPFGVADAVRGRGIGAVLLYRTLERMKARKRRRAWFMWTNDATADRIYRPAGFEETRRYSVMRKSLGGV